MFPATDPSEGFAQWCPIHDKIRAFYSPCHVLCGLCHLLCGLCHLLCGLCHVFCGLCHVLCGSYHVLCGSCHVLCGLCHVLCGPCHVLTYLPCKRLPKRHPFHRPLTKQLEGSFCQTNKSHAVMNTAWAQTTLSDFKSFPLSWWKQKGVNHDVIKPTGAHDPSPFSTRGKIRIPTGLVVSSGA